jgi:hypothetical protein
VIRLHYSQTWTGSKTPYLLAGRHDVTPTINTVDQNLNSSTAGGQTWKVHVQMTWERPLPHADINKNLFLQFVVDESHCVSR